MDLFRASRSPFTVPPGWSKTIVFTWIIRVLTSSGREAIPLHAVRADDQQMVRVLPVDKK